MKLTAVEKIYIQYLTDDHCITCKQPCMVPVAMLDKKSQCVKCNPERWCNVLESQTGIRLKIDEVKKIVNK